jgi:2-polyprenyl-6-methoxyphenol hydroxylase-like FAD-dependent oxidoreductase
VAERFADRFKAWRFDWLEVSGLIAGARRIYEYPLVDRDPLPTWTQGRVTLLGDAAHPMFPIGSNGASQAILDAESLALALRQHGTVLGLNEYEAARRPPTSKLVLLNRQNGPELVMQLAHERAPNGFKHVNDVIAQAELEGIAEHYKQAAGFTLTHVRAAGKPTLPN